MNKAVQFSCRNLASPLGVLMYPKNKDVGVGHFSATVTA